MADALVLDLDNGFIKRMEKADSVLKNMVKTADDLTGAFTNAFNSLKGSQFEDLISRISGEWKSLGNTKVSPNVDTSKLEDAVNIVTNLANVIGKMGDEKDTKLFDTQNIYATTKGLAETSDILERLDEEIKEKKKEWSEIPLQSKPTGFRRQRVNGILPAEGTEEYDKQINAYKKAQQLAIELELRALVEKQAIAKKELQWAKMTQDERLAYVKKTVEAILNESKKELQGAQREYQGVVREMTSLMKTTDSLSGKNNNGALNSQIAGLEQRYAELNARRVELEEQYGAHLVDIAKKANVKILAIEADRIIAKRKAEEKTAAEAREQYLSTPEGALGLASSAKTINEMKEAQKYLQIARGEVDVDNDIDTINRINEAYTRLRATIEALTTAERNEQSLQPSLRNEYSQLLKELDKIVAARQQLAGSEAYTSGDSSAKQQMSAIIAREEDISKRILAIRQAAGDKLLEVDRRHAADKAIIESEAARKSYEEQLKMYEKLWSDLEESQRSSVSGALEYANGAQSIKQQLDAIKYLKKAREELTVESAGGEEEYGKLIDELNDKIKSLQENTKALTGEFKDSSKEASAMSKILASAFSLQAIKGYISQLVRIRGEFELQQRSLQALLRSKDEANKLWQQTTQLALKSPYSVSQLIRSTKQLAAYRIESEKLYETNKMLSDISAGLGVEVDRLILAYGQVKAANYLRGTELRQFSEAGINILGELAKYFSELEGRAVTVGDVFGRVSKRMVSFADVETVLRSQVEAGGTFYRMQEKQAETLKGSISNLKDQFELMLNDIGQKNDGLLKSSVSGVAFLIKNWESLIGIMYAMGGAFVAHRLVVMTTNGAYVAMAKNLGIVAGREIQQLTLTQLLSLGYKKLAISAKNASAAMKSFLAANPGALAISALVVAIFKLGTALYDHRQKIKEIEKEYAELRKTATEISVKFNIAYDQKDLKGVKSELSQLISSVGNDYGLRIEVNTDNLNLEQAKAKFEEIYQTMWNANKLAEQVALYAQRNDVLADWWAFDTGFEGLSRDLNQYQSSFKKVFDMISKDAVSVAKALQKQRDGLTEVEKAYVENLVKSKQSNESEEAYMKRVIDAYIALSDKIETVGAKSNKVERNLRRLNRRTNEAAREMNKMFDDLNIDELLPNEEKESRIKVAIDKFAFDKGYSDIVEKLYDLANKRWGIHITPLLVQDKNESADWVKRIAPAVKAINDKIKEDLPEGAYARLFEVPTDTSELSTYISSVTSQITEATQEFVAGQKKYSDEEVRAWQVMAKYASEMRTLLNISEKANQGRSKDDIFSQKLRVIKEMYEEYKKLLKLFSEAEAKEGAMEKVGSAFKEAFGKTPDDMGFNLFSEEGFKDAIDKLIEQAPTAAAKVQAELAKVGIVWDTKIELKESDDKKLTKKIEDLFSGYELSIELGKLNIPPDFAKDFFGLEAVNLSELRSQIQSKAEVFVGADRVAEYEEYLRKIDKLEEAAQHERLKKYLQYSRNAIGERAKIKLEELRKLAEIEETFNKAKADAGDDKDKIATVESQKNLAMEGVKRESQDAIRKLDWEDFKSSEVFVNLFQDLDNASDSLLNHAINKIREFKEEWKDMPIESAREMVMKLKELELALMDTGRPGKDNKELQKFIDEQKKNLGLEATASSREVYEAVSTDNAKIDQENALAQQRIATLETINNLKLQGQNVDLKTLGLEEAQLKAMGLSSDILSNEVSANQTLINQGRTLLKNNATRAADNTKVLNALQKQSENYKKQADAIGEAQKMTNDLYGASMDLVEVLGGDDGPAAIFAEMGVNMLNNVLSTVQLWLQLKAATGAAQGLGAAMNTAMGIVGWIVMAIQLVVEAIKAIVASAAKARQELIDEQLKKVEKLKEKYDEFVDQMDKAFSTEQLERYNAMLAETNREMIEAQKRAIALQSEKKDVKRGKTDSDDYKEYLDMLKELEEMEKDHAETLVDIWNEATDNIFQNTFDTARDFVDAWHDAFLEAGNGMQGLEEQFRDMLKDMLRNAASKSLIAPLVAQMTASLKKYVNAETNDLDFTTDEAAKWKAESQPLLDQMHALLTQFFGATQGWFEETGGLSDLSKGIQGVTETTAQVIEAYLNSVRFYVADSNNKLSTLISLMGGTDNAGVNPMVEQLRIIAINTSAIGALLADSTYGGRNGKGFRVFLQE